MFDIGFLELLIIAVVGLLVIGPEQLPQTLRSIGLWVGRFKRALQQTRNEFEQHIGADDIRRQLHNEEVMKRLNETRDDINRVVHNETAAIEDSFKDLENTQATDTAAESVTDTKNHTTKDRTKS
jgi:sec-independent protein translocase protein TatB